MKVVVMGSGIIGISTAWWLNQAGHEVVVIDREPGPAQETSRANVPRLQAVISGSVCLTRFVIFFACDMFRQFAAVLQVLE